MDPYSRHDNSREMRVARIAVIETLERVGANLPVRTVSDIAAKVCNDIAASASTAALRHLPSDAAADILLRAVEEGSIDREAAERQANELRILGPLRDRLYALEAFGTTDELPSDDDSFERALARGATS